jgi:2'-5' RNA ligase
MGKPRYGLVGYVRSPVGEFVENLRRELHPELPHLAAHLTILPPRLLAGTEASAIETLERICSQASTFEVELGNVETFVPVTPTVYIRVETGSPNMRELHELLNTEALAYNEEWPYIPHLTIVKMGDLAAAQNAYKIAAERWAGFTGSRRILLEQLIFVREEGQNSWLNLAPVPLGKRLVSR